MAKRLNGCSDSGRQALVQNLLDLQPRLRVYALSLTHDRDRADDLVQEVLLKGITHLDSFQVGTNLGAWIFRIMRNEFLSGIRRRKHTVSLDGLENVLSFSTQPHTESAVDFRTMLLYLACLQREQSDALIAAVYLGMRYETIAEQFGCSVGTIKSRISRGRDMLARLMDETAIKQVDTAWFKTATRGIPKGHSYYPIAKAYEDLYAGIEDVGVTKDGLTSEKLWNDLVASGALDENQEDLSELIQGR